ncbi:MAG: hypothetical protein ACI9D5_002040 [Candidatus Endobugula sp.]|jgi:hypothetical protein
MELCVLTTHPFLLCQVISVPIDHRHTLYVELEHNRIQNLSIILSVYASILALTVSYHWVFLGYSLGVSMRAIGFFHYHYDIFTEQQRNLVALYRNGVKGH